VAARVNRRIVRWLTDNFHILSIFFNFHVLKIKLEPYKKEIKLDQLVTYKIPITIEQLVNEKSLYMIMIKYCWQKNTTKSKSACECSGCTMSGTPSKPRRHGGTPR
jgi:hypothetical protein